MAEIPIISVEAVSKAYRIWESPSARLIAPMLESIGRNLPAGSGLRRALVNDATRRYRDFWALRDVSFQVGRGECVGIIGRNGSGKSTLLQIIAGTLQPTTGTTRVHGRVAALLELGSGFNPDFTGRENVYLNAAVLGLSRREVDERFDRIAAFADIGDFIDQPVKTYSSGMFVRLAFAVQTAVDPQILIVDEALSVGDVFFQQRCYERMRQLLDAGVCVVMASHDLGSVQQFCQRTLVFRQGRVAYHGPSAEATMMYFQIEQQEKASSFLATRETAAAPAAEAAPAETTGALPHWPPESARVSTDGCRTIGNGWARCTYLAVCNQADEPWQHFRQGETLRVYYEFEALCDMEYCTGSVTIRDKTAQPVHSRITLQDGLRHPARVVKGTRLRFRQDTVLNLHCADYTLDVSLEMLPAALIARPGLSYDEYLQSHLRICELPVAATFTLRLRNETGPFQLLHFGMAGLPGTSMVEILPPPAQ